jgi:hypothetical protein
VLAPAALLGWIALFWVLFRITSRAKYILASLQRRLAGQGFPDPTGPPEREKHLYSAAGINRANVVAGLGLIGAIGAALIALLFPSLSARTAAVLGVIVATILPAAIFVAYEKRVWRWPATAYIPHATMPELNGNWEGHIEIIRGVEGEETRRRIGCAVRITQDWSRVAIDFTTAATESWSVMATIDAERVHYEYFVVARADAEPDTDNELAHVAPHYGMARLVPHPPPGPGKRCVQLDGFWFNDQHFLRWGNIALSRVDS